MKTKLLIFMIICVVTCFTLGACFNMSAGSALKDLLKPIEDDDKLVEKSENKTFKIGRRLALVDS